MKKLVAAIAFISIIVSSTLLYAKDQVYYTENLYITSYYTVDVYHGNKKVGFLYAGVRAKIIKTTKHWLLVEFWNGEKNMTGWIRR